MSDNLGVLLRKVDDASSRLRGLQMVNHYAYLKWPESDRIAFDVQMEKARIDLADAQAAYAKAIHSAAKFDPND